MKAKQPVNVFISYAKHDAPRVNEIVRRLVARGLRNASGMTSRIELERAAERLESRSHAERGNEGFPGHDVFGLGIGKLFPARSLLIRRIKS
jgi:hypothetical protein